MTEAANEVAQLVSSHMWEGAGAWAAWKLVGPPLLEFTEGARRWVSHKVGNTQAIVEKAVEMAGDELEVPGSVHPRVVSRILEEGSNIDDPVMQSYLAGMLKASRTPDGQDDRATYYLGLIANMTVNQTRLHHGIYAALAADQSRHLVDLGDPDAQLDNSVLAWVSDADSMVAVRNDERTVDVLGEAAAGLVREQLLTRAVVGNPDRLAKDNIFADEAALIGVPSAMGCLLYLWGHGVRTARPEDIGRVDLPALPSPGPQFARPWVGNWFDKPVTRADLRDFERTRESQLREAMTRSGLT